MSEGYSAASALAELRKERAAIAAQIERFNSPEERERRVAARVLV